MKRIASAFRGGTLTARTLRSTSWVLMSYGGGQAIRLASNLILTRILFPEAFGLMALVTMVTVGLMMFSDVGIGPSIQRSPRGDEPAFLNTAWSLQVLRGLALFSLTVLLARPMAEIYDQPDLARYLPIAGIALIFTGFLPTKVESAKRHLQFGRLTVLELTSAAIGLGAMVAVALATRSVMALVLGGVFTASVHLILTNLFLDGIRNRFRFEREAMREQVSFGKWVFLSTAFAFLSQQGDKAILGKLLSLDTLGIYNIGFFLASFPLALGMSVSQNILIPLYRDRPPAASRENWMKIRKMRLLLTSSVFTLLIAMAFLGPWLVRVLYDDRYINAGGMLVLVATGLLAQVLGLSYERLALAAGDSRGAFVYSGLRSAVQLTALVLGLMLFGLVGGLASIGLSMLLVHPILIALARRHGAWDALHDGLFLAIGLTFGGFAIWYHLEAIRPLLGLAVGAG